MLNWSSSHLPGCSLKRSDSAIKALESDPGSCGLLWSFWLLILKEREEKKKKKFYIYLSLYLWSNLNPKPADAAGGAAGLGQGGCGAGPWGGLLLDGVLDPKKALSAP